MPRETRTTIKWGETETDYQEWLKEPVFLSWENLSPLGCEVEALAHVALKRSVPEAVITALGQGEKETMKNWNKLPSDLKESMNEMMRQSLAQAVIISHFPHGMYDKKEGQILQNNLAMAVGVRGDQLILDS